MIYFITVNYYSTEFIEQLLNSIAGTQKHYNLLIINNSPKDTSIRKLAQTYSGVTLINNKTNLGFGAACNVGIQYVYQRNPQGIIWLINPDTTIDESAIYCIKDCLNQKQPISILGTKIRDLEGDIWFSFGTFNPWTGSLKHQGKAKGVYDYSINTINCRWVSGCSLILNLKQFDHCPRFDPNYFLYYEDADLCERYYKQGYRVAVTQAVLVTHAVSAIAKQNQSNQLKHATYSKLYFLKQHGTSLALCLNLVYMLVLVVLLFSQHRAAAIGRWQGIKNFILKDSSR